MPKIKAHIKLSQLRNQIQALLETNSIGQALDLARESAKDRKTSDCWRVIHRVLDNSKKSIRGEVNDSSVVRIAIAASFTLDNLIPYLNVAFLIDNLTAEFYLCPYDQYQMEFRSDSSGLKEFQPDFTILFADMESIVGTDLPKLRSQSPDFLRNLDNSVIALLDSFQKNVGGRLIFTNFIPPSVPLLGVFENNFGLGIFDCHHVANNRLAEIIGAKNFVTLFDVAHLISRIGTDHAINRRAQFMARMPLSEQFSITLACEYLNFIRGLKGLNRKCLVVDLDNTLWGGVVGEDGVYGISIGSDYPGNIYSEIQSAILGLHNRGVILAIASKNNHDDALAVFSERSEMVLKEKNFAVKEISWSDKASSLKRIAEQLNIGIDSLVFLDDSPQERHLIETELPEVAVFPFPEDICALPDLLATCGYFDTPTLTEEDLNRGEMYAQRALRAQASEAAVDIDAYLHSLNINIDIRHADVSDIPRVAQMTQKTNQFNLTTRRYSEGEVKELLRNPDWRVIILSAKDRFGDEGIVSTAFLRRTNTVTSIELLLMSCRILGRGIDKAFLVTIVEYCFEKFKGPIQGIYSETKKNSQVKNFYSNNGFFSVSPNIWQLDANNTLPEIPAWIICNTELSED